MTRFLTAATVTALSVYLAILAMETAPYAASLRAQTIERNLP